MEHEALLQELVKTNCLLQSERSIYRRCVSMIVNGFCKEVFNELPMEFAVEAQKLMEVSLEDLLANLE